jgi:hypothetical protein
MGDHMYVNGWHCSCLQAVSLDGRIYLVGGMDEARNRSACVDAFDPREGSWQALAGLSSARSSAGLAALQVDAVEIITMSCTLLQHCTK